MTNEPVTLKINGREYKATPGDVVTLDSFAIDEYGESGIMVKVRAANPRVALVEFDALSIFENDGSVPHIFRPGEK